MHWKILIADDDPDIAAFAQASLEGFRYRGRTLDCLLATSATEALNCLSQQDDIAVAFIDVQMETPRAGIELIQRLRASDSAWRTRIIVLTGNADLAPELDATLQCDLDGYIEKSQLHGDRLHAMTYSALRNYDLISRLEHSRHAILNAVRTLSQLDSADEMVRNLNVTISDLVRVGRDLRDGEAWSWGSEGSVSRRPRGTPEALKSDHPRTADGAD